MSVTKITLHPSFKIGAISKRLYSSFLEPIGTMVNGTMFNPKHPSADSQGFRTDIIEALKKTPNPAVRLPGGNFVSGWDWKDSIGPMESRKAHLDLAWHQYIPNDVGHDEYLQWAEKIGTEPLYTLNLGTAGINDAVACVEYTNHEGGTWWSDLRRKNGHEAPYGVKLWYLGNEMDGPWQVGSWERDPKGYGIRANEISKAIKWVDGSIETGVCGSSAPFMAHFPEWDLTVMQECYEAVDYLSIHHYHSAAPGDMGALLGGALYYEDFINTECAMLDYVQAKCRSPKKMMISFDEYGAMPRKPRDYRYGYGIHNLYADHYVFSPDRKFVRHDPDNMFPGRPPMPRRGEMTGALGNASILLAFLRHADRVKVGCMTGGLGTLVSSDKEHTWRGAGYYPFTQLMQYGQGVSLMPSVSGDTFDIPGYMVDDNSQYPTKEGVPFIDCAAAYREDSSEAAIFLINRDWQNARSVEIDISGFEGYTLKEHLELYSDDLDAYNSFEEPDKIIPKKNTASKCENGKITCELKSLSWNVIRIAKN